MDAAAYGPDAHLDERAQGAEAAHPAPDAREGPMTSAPADGPVPSVRVRNFWLCVLLSVVTLGIYGAYYHYKTHDELHRHLGRVNRDRRIFWAMVVSYLVGVAFTLVAILATFAAIGSLANALTATGPSDAASSFSGLALLVIPGILAMLASVVLWFIYIFRQFSLWAQAREDLALRRRPGIGWWTGFTFGGGIVGAFVPGLSLLTGPTAYWHLVHGYNEIATTTPGDVAPPPAAVLSV